MARGKSRRRSGGGQKSFCPVIRLRCSRKFSRAEASTAPSATHRKFATFQAAKKKLRKAMGLGNVHPQAEATSLPKAVVTKVSHAASNMATCTVSMAGRSWRLKGAAVGSKVAELMRAQRAGGCCHPKVSRG